MTVRAKMRVVAVNPLDWGGPGAVCSEVRMMPVSSDSPENATWSKATPSGECRMVITNPDAIAAFETGKEYFLDFTPAS